MNVAVVENVSFDQSLDSLIEQIENVRDAVGVRAGGQALAEVLEGVRLAGRNMVGATNAKEAILTYLYDNQGDAVLGSELAAVSGIQEYARRIRELREEGWRILSGTSVPTAWELGRLRAYGIEKLGADHYVLLATNPTRERDRNRKR